MKSIIINVDDLGFSHAVNQAVIDLAEKKRIQAAVCAGWPVAPQHPQHRRDGIWRP